MHKTLIFAILAVYPGLLWADVFEKGDSILVQTSLYTLHFDPDEDHTNNQRLLALELDKASGWVFGFAFFQNSFDQPSQYLFGGYSWTLPKTRDMAYFKLTGGLLHGYTGEHQDAIPFNSSGIAPAILPSFGIKYKWVSSELMIFGTAGLMLSIGVNFPIGGD